jgi:hypothetical protein
MKTDYQKEVSVCYSVYAPVRTLTTIMTLIDGLYRIYSGGSEVDSYGLCLPLSWLMKALVGEASCDGDIMNCIQMPYGTVEILMICDISAVEPFRDALLDCFPEIERIDVVC